MNGMNDEKERFFTQTVRERSPSLWRIAFSILRSGADAEDAVADAVEKTWEHLDRIRSDGAIPFYLMKCTVNAAHDELRRRKRLTPFESLEDTPAGPERERGIADYVAGLEEKYRLPLLLKYDENMKEKEIAFVLRLPRGTVSSRISRGLDMLRKQMEKEDTDHE